MTTWYLRMQGKLPSGDQWQSGLHVNSASSDPAVVGAAWSDAVTLLWSGDGDTVTGIKGLVTSTTTLVQLFATSLDLTTGRGTAQYEAAASFVGTGTGDAGVPQSAPVLSLKTAVPTRAGRGRMYLPAFDTAAMETDGLMSSGTVATMVAACSAMIESLQGDGCVPVIYHRAQPDLSIVGSTDDVTSSSVLNVPGVQRRRRNKVLGTRSDVPIA